MKRNTAERIKSAPFSWRGGIRAEHADALVACYETTASSSGQASTGSVQAEFELIALMRTVLGVRLMSAGSR
jgi:hypothetical protein